VEEEEQLMTVQTGARHLRAPNDDLLEVARVESGKTDVSLTRSDCARLRPKVTTAIVAADRLLLRRNLAFVRQGMISSEHSRPWQHMRADVTCAPDMRLFPTAGTALRKDRPAPGRLRV
jgi:hypothetical protein